MSNLPFGTERRIPEHTIKTHPGKLVGKHHAGPIAKDPQQKVREELTAALDHYSQFNEATRGRLVEMVLPYKYLSTLNFRYLAAALIIWEHGAQQLLEAGHQIWNSEVASSVLEYLKKAPKTTTQNLEYTQEGQALKDKEQIVTYIWIIRKIAAES